MATYRNLIRIIPIYNSQILRTSSVRASPDISMLPSSTARAFTNLSRLGHESKLTSTEAGQSSNLLLQRFYSANTSPHDTTDDDNDLIKRFLSLRASDLLDVLVGLRGRSIANGVFGWIAIRKSICAVDPEFDSKDFVRDAAQTIETVSHRLANQEYDGLEGLVTPQALSALKENIEKMTEEQRSKIAVKREEFQRVLWTEIKLQEDKGVDPPKRFVEIKVFFQAFANRPNRFAEVKKFIESKAIVGQPIDVEEIKVYILKRTLIGCYRFKRDYTEGVQGEWIVDLVVQSNMLALREKEK